LSKAIEIGWYQAESLLSDDEISIERSTEN